MKSDPSIITEKIQSFIYEAAHVDKEKIQNDSLVFKEGYIDSIGIMLLISFIEKEFGIKIANTDLTEENFKSINAISAFIIKKI